MFKFNKKNDNTNSSRELHIPARDIDVSLTADDARNMQHVTRENMVTRLIVSADKAIKKEIESNPDSTHKLLPLSIDTLSPEMVDFVHHYLEKGFSVSLDYNGYVISWEKKYNQVQPSDPRFITKELEDSFYNLLTYHTSYSYLLTISDFQFDKDNVSDEADLECILKVQPVSIGGQKATTLLSTKGVTYTYPAEDVWKNLMRVKTFLSAYNNKYGTNTSK